MLVNLWLIVLWSDVSPYSNEPAARNIRMKLNTTDPSAVFRCSIEAMY